MKTVAKHAPFLRTLSALVDLRIVLIGAGLFGIASCTSETQGNTVAPTLGVYVQIDRVGRPGVKEIFENFSDHETTNRNPPASDATLSTAMTNYLTNTSGTLAPKATAAQATTITAIFTPDEMQANLGAASTTGDYLGIESGRADFGGRGFADAAMEADLAAIYGGAFASGITGNACLATDNLPNGTYRATQPGTTFPYIN